MEDLQRATSPAMLLSHTSDHDGYDTRYAKSFRHFTREALPRLDNYRNIMSIQAAYRPTLDELHNATLHGKVSTWLLLPVHLSPRNGSSGSLKSRLFRSFTTIQHCLISKLSFVYHNSELPFLHEFLPFLAHFPLLMEGTGLTRSPFEIIGLWTCPWSGILKNTTFRKLDRLPKRHVLLFSLEHWMMDKVKKIK
jgi:hypothetical protein